MMGKVRRLGETSLGALKTKTVTYPVLPSRILYLDTQPCCSPPLGALQCEIL